MAQFPSEIFEHILFQLPPSRSNDSSVVTLARFSETSSRLRDIARLPILWRDHYRIRWSHADPGEELDRLMRLEKDWSALYAERRHKDHRALHLLDGIIVSRQGRYDRANELVLDLGYDVWDVLLLQTSSTEPFNPREPRSLARAFWARQAMGAISRKQIIRRWGMLRRGGEMGFVESATGFSTFWGVDFSEVNELLDVLTAGCQEFLQSRNVALEPNSPTYDITELASAICAWMRTEGFGSATTERYHDLMNQFPHKVLTTHRRTLPISLVWVFIAVAEKLGTKCLPVAFPGQVIAFVPHPNSGEPIWVDVFDYDNGPIKSRNDLTSRLASLGFPPHEFDAYIMPCSTMEISQRIISNVMHAVNLELTTPTRPSRLAIQVSLYSGFVWTAAMFPERATEFSSSLIASAGFAFPLDFGPIILGCVVPSLPAGTRSVMDRACRDAMVEELSAPETMSRSVGSKFFVGMLFRYEGRIAVVTGWNTRCMASNGWISRSRIDELPRGRKQPFYAASDTEGNFIYCAEDLVEPERNASVDDLMAIWNTNQLLGPVFDRVEVVQDRCRFIMSELHQDKYPDDEEAALRFYEESL